MTLVRGPVILVLAAAIALGGCAGDDGADRGSGATRPSSGDAPASTTTTVTPARHDGSFFYVLPGPDEYPEGVTYDPATDRFFVTSTTDGTIWVRDRSGDVVTAFSEPGADGRETAVGLAVDQERRRLWVAGGVAQTAYVYDLDTGDLVADYEAPPVAGSLINDVAVAPDGDAYLTDSGPRPVLFRVSGAGDEPGELEAWLDLSTTPIPTDGAINLNGIVATEDGQDLLAVHLARQQLFRIDRESGAVTEVGAPGAVGPGDGLVLDGDTLWVVTATGVQRFEIGPAPGDLRAGPTVDDPTFAFPTTAAKVGDRLLVVNSQFDRQGADDPELPFTVSEIPAP